MHTPPYHLQSANETRGPMTKTEWRRMQFVKATDELLYGSHWGRQLAKDLNLSNVTVYQYANCKAVVPLHIFTRCDELLEARKHAITALRTALMFAFKGSDTIFRFRCIGGSAERCAQPETGPEDAG